MLSQKSVQNIAKLLYPKLDNLIFTTIGEYEMSTEQFSILLYNNAKEVVRNEVGLPTVDISQLLFNQIVSTLIAIYTDKS